MSKNTRRLVDVKGLTEHCQVTEHWVRRAVRERRIPHHKLGALLRFDLDEIDQWLDSDCRRDAVAK